MVQPLSMGGMTIGAATPSIVAAVPSPPFRLLLTAPSLADIRRTGGLRAVLPKSDDGARILGRQDQKSQDFFGSSDLTHSGVVNCGQMSQKFGYGGLIWNNKGSLQPGVGSRRRCF
jgi:hypothetical protein